MREFEILWNPWRYAYVSSASKRDKTCIFCTLPRKEDKEAYIVYRGKYAYIALNAYPYNSGHIMIIPYRHLASIELLNAEELGEVLELIVKSVKALRESFNPDGFNIGINIGRAAGAGIADHIHVHIVPRWVGDTNFMAVIASTKTLPISLEESYKLLRDAWKKLYGE
ncbi:MAG: HIT family hydrolase [Thermoprotei archaeon]|nr:MAG: HIT family hydrolase [Thermoprotei archaeon]